MKKVTFFLLLLPAILVAQRTTILKGTVKDKNKKPIENVFVAFDQAGTVTDENGNYTLRIPVKKEIVLISVSFGLFIVKYYRENNFI